jgi:PAP2 superfamily protein
VTGTSRMPRSRRAIVGIVAVVAIVAGAGASIVVPRQTLADAPARWHPFLLPSPSAVRPPPPPADGSARDRIDLDEVVALQARASRDDPEIAYWTSVPSPVRWNEILLARIREIKLNPVRAARALGLLNAAMYDAVIAACEAKLAYPRSNPAGRDAHIRTVGQPDEISAYASSDAAIAAAATTVLTYLFPGWESEFAASADAARRVRMVTGMATASDIEAGTRIGEAVGTLAVERGKSDGSDALWHGTIPTFPGAWIPAAPFRNTQPTEPMAGTWRPWLMTSGSAFRPGPPPAYQSAEWQADAAEIVAVTNSLTDDQVTIARFWADGAGTNTPPGHWMRFALDYAVRDHLSTSQAVRVFAYLGTVEADAFIACWDTKYAYWSGRPTGLIKGFASTIITPNFPAYMSGHATVSGASSVVLSYFFQRDSAALRANAEQAALSRLYGGIHWRTDNEVGLEVGRKVGAIAVARATQDLLH